MRVLKNTLYVQTPDSWLHKQGENVVLKVDRETVGRVPVHKLQSIVCFGNVTVTSPLMAHCWQNAISISFLDQFGRFQARVEGPTTGNVLLRREQYRIADDQERTLSTCHTFLLGKFYNQRQVVNRCLRDYRDTLTEEAVNTLEYTQKRLRVGIKKALTLSSLQDLLGLEGELARQYFAAFKVLIRNEDFEFYGRTRNPPTDRVNALLSLAYVILTHDCRSALETVGVDPYCGFYHQLRPGRASLALDIVEEFRPVADRFVLSLINRKQVNKSSFEVQDNGAVSLTESGRRTFFKAWQDRKQDELNHAWFEEKAPLGLFPLLQAQIMARYIRGDIDSYVPFLWK